MEERDSQGSRITVVIVGESDSGREIVKKSVAKKVLPNKMNKTVPVLRPDEIAARGRVHYATMIGQGSVQHFGKYLTAQSLPFPAQASNIFESNLAERTAAHHLARRWYWST